MNDTDCLFCKIVAGKIPATRRYEDPEFLAFDDISHQAPVHVLIIPKVHVKDLVDAPITLVGKLQNLIPDLAKKLAIAEAYKVNLNAGRYQEVPHLHYHLKGGE